MQCERLRLVADIGGTRTRFALSRSDCALEQTSVVSTADHDSLVDAAQSYLDGLRNRLSPTEAVLAVACPVTGDRVELTNSDWRFSIEDARRKLGLERLSVINDVEAVAMAVPYMEEEDLLRLGDVKTDEVAPRAVIAPGTGLGMAGLIPIGERWVPLASEGGHVTFAPQNDAEIALLRSLGKRFAHVSAERLISGPGLVNIYNHLAELEGQQPEDYRPEDVSSRAKSQSDGLCVEAMRQFTAMLGSAAGDLVMTLGARGGLYIGGGIARDIGPSFDADLFRKRFAAKGRLHDYLAAVPAYVIQHRYPALLGAAHLRLEEVR